MIKNGIVRSVKSELQEEELKKKGYEEFKPKKVKKTQDKEEEQK